MVFKVELIFWMLLGIHLPKYFKWQIFYISQIVHEQV